MRQITLVVALAALVVLGAGCIAKSPRVGFEESFDAAERWQQAGAQPTRGTPLAKVQVKDGLLTLVTPCGALDETMKRPDWPEWPKNPATGFTTVTVNYDRLVDFDTYRYLVVRTTEKGCYALLSVNGKKTKVLYSTGTHAQDLSTLGLTGKQKVSLSIEFLNSSNWITLDHIRLVRELSPEEQKGFVDDGLTIREEHWKSQPVHGLVALNERAGRPIKSNPTGGERCVYRDTGTGAEIWKMTASPLADEHSLSWNCDGSAFKIHGRSKGGFEIFDFRTRSWVNMVGGMGDAAPRFSRTDPDAMIVTRMQRSADGKSRRLSLHNVNWRTKAESELLSFDSTEPHFVYELSASRLSNKMLFGMRETPTVMLLDPDSKDPAQRARKITLPTRLKAVHFGRSDDEILWYNCYTYQFWRMDLRTGTVSHAPVPMAGGHSIGGPEWTIGPYESLMKLLVRNGLDVQTEMTADDVKIWGNYAHPVSTDYGAMSRDGRWAVTDGDEGDVAGQHLMLSVNDPATVLRACFHHTSRNDWVTNTYSWASPDATKIALISDQFDDGDLYMVITTRPKPPTNLRGTRVDGMSKLKWDAPEGAREIAGYRIYRSQTSGRGFVPLSAEPIAATEYEDTFAPKFGPVFYLVAAVEHSGLEGYFSNEAAAGADREPRTIYLEAEHGQWTAPIREVLHGDASGSRFLRSHQASPKEPKDGKIRWDVTLPAGRYSLWVRGKDENPRPFSYEEPPLILRWAGAPRDDFGWSEVQQGIDLQQGQTTITSPDLDGIAVDQVALTTDPDFDPTRPVTLPPSPVRNLLPSDMTSNSVKLSWQPSTEKNLARYDIHVGAGPLGNRTIIGSTRENQFEDWGLRPGAIYTYSVVAVDSRGNVSKPTVIQGQTVDLSVQNLKADAKTAADTATFPLDVSADGQFMLWVTYDPAYVKGDDFMVDIEIDGKAAGQWRLRAPYRPMWWTLAEGKDRPPRTFTDKIVADGKDVFALTKGQHMITIRPKTDLSEQHKFATLQASSDMSYQPSGYMPQANFYKDRKEAVATQPAATAR